MNEYKPDLGNLPKKPYKATISFYDPELSKKQEKMRELELRWKIWKSVMKEKPTKRVFNDIDPYGEENWED